MTKFLFLISVYLLHSFAFAAEFWAPSSLGPEDLVIYNKTFASCQNKKIFNSQSYETFVNSMNQVFYVSENIYKGDTDAFASYIANKGITPELNRWLQSTGFIYAVNNCFGKNQAMKDFYVMSLVFVWDLIPRFLGTYINGRLIVKSKILSWYFSLMAVFKIKGDQHDKNFSFDNEDVIKKVNSMFAQQEMYLKEELRKAKSQGQVEKAKQIESLLVEVNSLKVGMP